MTNSTNSGDAYLATLMSPAYLAHTLGLGSAVIGFLYFIFRLMFVKRIIRSHRYHNLYFEMTKFNVQHLSTFLSPNHEIVRSYYEPGKRSLKELGEGISYIYLDKTRWSSLAWAERVDTERERGSTRSAMIITTFRWNTKLLDDILQAKTNVDTPASLYQPDGNNWNYVRRLRKTICTVTPTFKRVRGVVENFLKNKQTYLDNGKSYTLAILMNSPPGSGKTSFIAQMCFELNLSLGYIDSWNNVDDFNKLVKNMINPNRVNVILLEDFSKKSLQGQSDDDEPGGKRRKKNGHDLKVILMNTLDGLGKPDNIIFIINTNEIKSIPPELIRPGRINHTFYCKPEDCVITSFLEHYPGQDELAKSLATKLSSLSYGIGIVADKIREEHPNKSPETMVNDLVQWFIDHPADGKTQPETEDEVVPTPVGEDIEPSPVEEDIEPTPVEEDIEPVTMVDDFCWM